MAETKTWRLSAVSDGKTLRCSSAPDDPQPLEIEWNGPPGAAAYAMFERVGEWETHEYTSSCSCHVRVHGADGALLCELQVELRD